MPLGVVDLLQVRIVPDRPDARLQRDHLVVAGHHCDGAELQALRQMHRSDRGVAGWGFGVVVEHLEGETRRPDR